MLGFANAFTSSDLKMVLNDENVSMKLEDSQIKEIIPAACGRVRGDFCLEIKLSDDRIISVDGNNFFNTVTVRD